MHPADRRPRAGQESQLPDGWRRRRVMAATDLECVASKYFAIRRRGRLGYPPDARRGCRRPLLTSNRRIAAAAAAVEAQAVEKKPSFQSDHRRRREARVRTGRRLWKRTAPPARPLTNGDVPACCPPALRSRLSIRDAGRWPGLAALPGDGPQLPKRSANVDELSGDGAVRSRLNPSIGSDHQCSFAPFASVTSIPPVGSLGVARWGWTDAGRGVPSSKKFSPVLPLPFGPPSNP